MLSILRAQFPADQFTLMAVILGLPLLGALVNALFGKRLGKQAVSTLALVAIGGSFVASLVAFALLADASASTAAPAVARFRWELWRWFSLTGRGGFSTVPIDVAFSVDSLSATMALIVTGVGFLIHVYSTGYMAKDPGYHRFFAYLNLFIFSMLVLVLGDNMAVLFVGWEGVGLCSYLLIGFWFDDEAKASAGKKAFITNRIGDFGLLVAMAMLVYHVGSLGWRDLELGTGALTTTVQLWPIGRLEQTALPTFLVRWLTPDEPVRVYVTTLVALFLFLGCAGKSAQIPLYVWLPDAMAGPTPVSALIHAATMVTAGVYLVARTSFLFVLSPAAMATVATIGAVTALFAATIAFAQNDLKKVLAYSTVSQLGFMFIGVGVGAFGAGIFHVLTHAFFKGCLFLCAGSVIHAMHARLHGDDVVQDMRRMGGLRRFMPVTHWTFLIAGLALAGCPPLAGFWSKDEILWRAFSTRIRAASPDMWVPPTYFAPAIFVLGILAAIGTAFYIFRAYYLTFCGDFRGWTIVPRWRRAKAPDHATATAAELPGPAPKESPRVMTVPLVLLAAGAAVAGLLYAEPIHVAPLGHFLAPVFGPAGRFVVSRGVDALLLPLLGVGVAAFVGGALGAWWVYQRRRGEPARRFAESKLGGRLHRGALHKWWVDEAYEATVLGLVHAMGDTAAQFDRVVVDGILSRVTTGVAKLLGAGLRLLQTGRVQAYVASMVLGVAGVGWFLLAPHAQANVDDTQLQRGGTLTLTAAPGTGYAYRWHLEGEEPPKDFGPQTRHEVKLDLCETKTVILEVRDGLGRIARQSFRRCRMAPAIPGCCGPGSRPLRTPETLQVPVVPTLSPGEHDAGVLQELLSPRRRPLGGQAAPQGGTP